MTYMGGKQKLQKYLLPIINKYIKDNEIENFYDVFCGGFNIGAYVDCENIYANDLSPTLIGLHKQAQEDFSKICHDGSREQWDRCYDEYKKVKKRNFTIEPEIPYSEIGAIEWFGGFSGRGFPGGYGVKSEGRNLFEERYNNLKAQSEEEGYQKAIFTCKDYRELEFKDNSLIFCDAPYKETKAYGINTKFNYAEYYKWLLQTATQFPIIICEQSLPADVPAEVIWQKEVKRDIDHNKAKKTEKMYLLDLRSET